MSGTPPREYVLVTGAGGQIGSRLCPLLRAAGHAVLAVDVRHGGDESIKICDIRKAEQVVQLFESGSIRTVIHLAGVLPTAFRADPIAAAAVNLGGTFGLLREAVARRVRRFVFASSISVYGSSHTSQAIGEDTRATPDEPYGAAKLVAELIGENLAAASRLEFASLRIARVVGQGARNTASSWRSRIFEPAATSDLSPISIPFAPSARLSLVHVDQVARMLVLLSEVTALRRRVYNTPAEVWRTRELAELVQRVRRVRVELGEAHGGPVCDGALFAQDFAFRLRGLGDYLTATG
jgi:nucleoside-diphosphate-sugar epimerase